MNVLDLGVNSNASKSPEKMTPSALKPTIKHKQLR